MATMAFDTHKAVQDLKAAGASEDLARAVVRIISDSAARDVVPRDETLDRAQIRLALSTVELRITERFAWLSLGVFGSAVFTSLMLIIPFLGR